MAHDEDESEAHKKQVDLQQRIRDRAVRVKRQQERLEQLNEQLEHLEGPQRHTIEQLREEIAKVDKDLNTARQDTVAAKAKLAESTEALEKKTQEKRIASDSLYTMLLDSEEGKMAKLGEMEKRFGELRLVPGPGGKS